MSALDCGRFWPRASSRDERAPPVRLTVELAQLLEGRDVGALSDTSVPLAEHHGLTTERHARERTIAQVRLRAEVLTDDAALLHVDTFPDEHKKASFRRKRLVLRAVVTAERGAPDRIRCPIPSAHRIASSDPAHCPVPARHPSPTSSDVKGDHAPQAFSPACAFAFVLGKGTPVRCTIASRPARCPSSSRKCGQSCTPTGPTSFLR